jgi:hypothetical protein
MKKFGSNISSVAFALLVSLSSFYYSSCIAGGAPVYDYHHVDTWNTEFAGENGNCDGRKQSPIALETMDCTHFANYEMNVSNNRIAVAWWCVSTVV